MTAKKFIECIRIAHPNDPLSSTLRVQITNYFYSQSPRTGFVDPESKLLFGLNDRASLAKRMMGHALLITGEIRQHKHTIVEGSRFTTLLNTVHLRRVLVKTSASQP